MILYLDEAGCTTTRDKAVSVLFGVPEWVGNDIMEYGTKYCCEIMRPGRGKRLGIYRCEGMRGARNFTVDTYLCIDYFGRDFVLNEGNILDVRLPLVCMGRRVGGYLDSDALLRNYRYMLDVAKKANCKGHCVLDEAGRVVVFGDDLFNVVDNWAMLMRNKSITLFSVLV